MTDLSPGNLLLVANYESSVGYAWWLMENFWLQLAAAAQARGAATYLAYPLVTVVPSQIMQTSIRIVELNFDDTSVAGVRRILTLVREKKIRNVYLTDKPSWSLLYSVLRLAGVRTIINHDHSFRTGRADCDLRLRLKRFIQATGLGCCDHYVAVSAFIADQLVSSNGISPARVSVVLNGIEPIQANASDRLYVHGLFGLPADAVVVVSTGRATRFKGLDSLIRSARVLLDQDHSSVYFLHCGDGPDLCEFREQSRSLGLTGRFLFSGKREDVRRILPGCDIGVQASRGEALSLALLEYMSAGLPAVATDVGGNREVVVDGDNGFLVPLGDIGALSDRLAFLVADPAARKRMGDSARTRVLQRFDIRRANRELVDVCTRVMDAR